MLLASRADLVVALGVILFFLVTVGGALLYDAFRGPGAGVDEDHYDFRQTTLLLSLTDHQLRELVRSGELTAYRHNSSLQFRRVDVDALAHQQVRDSEARLSLQEAASEAALAPAEGGLPLLGRDEAAAVTPNLQISVNKGASREHCPFCRERVSSPQGQVVCVACLARHHEACWDEHGACSTCEGRERFSGVESTPGRRGSPTREQS